MVDGRGRRVRERERGETESLSIFRGHFIYVTFIYFSNTDGRRIHKYFIIYLKYPIKLPTVLRPSTFASGLLYLIAPPCAR